MSGDATSVPDRVPDRVRDHVRDHVRDQVPDRVPDATPAPPSRGSDRAAGEPSADTLRQLQAMRWQRSPATTGDRARHVWNVVNLSTLLGLLIAGVGGATLSRGPHGLILATGFRPRFPRAGAFTIGDVVISRRSRRRLLARPALVHHESRHCRQYACCLGLPMLPLYGACSLWSIARTGDPASRNIFERLAGLRDGDYVEHPIRRRRQRHGR